MDNTPEIAEHIPTPFSKGSSGDCLVRALAARGIAYRYLSRGEITNAKLARRRVVEFDLNGVLYYFDDGTLRVSDPRGVNVPGPNINGSTARFVWRKDLVKSFLRKHGFSVPEGAAFSRDSLHEAECYFTAVCSSPSGGVCVKPAADNRGRDVFIEIRELQSFRAAFGAVSERHKRVLIEEMVPGTVYRFTCFAGRVLAIRTGRPANVEGDGTHTIAELIDIKNRDRRRNPCLRRHMLHLGQKEGRLLESVGLGARSVPRTGQIVWLGTTTNRHQGADTIDATDTVHQSYIELIERAVRQLPGLVHCGPDVVVQDASLPATSDNYHILELNGNGPGFSSHHNPWRGQPRDVAGAIIDHLTKLTVATDATAKLRPRSLLGI